MSGPLRSLANANKPRNGQRPARLIPLYTTERQRSIIMSNEEEQRAAGDNWPPPEQWMTKVDDFVTTAENYGWRRNRAMITLRSLLKETGQLMEQPTQYISDIWWFRYLSSIKHCKIEHPLMTQIEFIDEGLPKLFMTFWTEHLCVTEMDRWKEVHKDSIEALYHMSMALWFISSNAEHQQRMYDMLGQFVITMVYGPAFQYHLPKVKRVQDCLKALLGIVYQFAKNIHKSKNMIRADRGIDFLQHLTSRERGFSRNVKSRALMILAFVLDEEEQKGVSVAESVIEFLIKLLKECLSNDDHRSAIYNYHALEVLDGLNLLAIADVNKDKINDNDGLPLYLDMLRSSSLAEQEEACKGLWTLCFSELVAENVANDSAIMSALESLAKSKHEPLKTAACGCLWTVQKLKDANKLQAAVSKAGHVMISYSWSVQPEAKELKQRLVDKGYRVWMDIENMSGSTLSSMSQAIEKSIIVLMLLSEQYKTSQACRAEAEYAYKLDREIIPLEVQEGYTADGWLGMLIGIRTSFNLSNPASKESTYEELIEALGEKGKGPPIVDAAEVEVPIVAHTRQESVVASVKPVQPSLPPQPAPQTYVAIDKELECVSWSETEITSWIDTKKLQAVVTCLGGEITGDILVELRYMLLQDTDHYYDLVRTDLKLPTVTILRLSASLRRLK